MRVTLSRPPLHPRAQRRQVIKHGASRHRQIPVAPEKEAFLSKQVDCVSQLGLQRRSVDLRVTARHDGAPRPTAYGPSQQLGKGGYKTARL